MGRQGLRIGAVLRGRVPGNRWEHHGRLVGKTMNWETYMDKKYEFPYIYIYIYLFFFIIYGLFISIGCFGNRLIGKNNP